MLELVGTIAVAVFAAVVVHEGGHVLAAGALGGSGFRISKVWPVIRVEATIPDGPGHELVFLLAGAVANLGAAAALFGFGGRVELLALVQGVMAVLSLMPVGESDGARLVGLLRGERSAPD